MKEKIELRRDYMVEVQGEVCYPGNYPITKESTRLSEIIQSAGGFTEYVRKAGGYAERARKDDMKIIKGKTKQWLSVKEMQVEEGDNIWVPLKPRRDFAYYMNIYSQMASALSVIVGIGVLIMQVTK